MAESKPTIRTNPRPDLRGQILDAAEVMFAERPYNDVYVEDIAESAGVAKGLVYYYFESKRGLYEAVIRMLGEELAIRTEPNRELPPLERTAAVIDQVIGWAQDHRAYGALAPYGGAGTDRIAREVFAEAQERQTDMMLAGMLESSRELGVADYHAAPEMRHAIKGWTAFIYVTVMRWANDPIVPAEELRELYLRSLSGLITAARETIDSDAT